MKKVLVLLKKDLLLEFRQHYALLGILLYVVSTIFVLNLAMGKPAGQVYNGLFWVIQLFICINAVAKSFLQESKGRMLYYFYLTSPVTFILSKIFYNGILSLLMVLLSLLLFLLLLGNPLNDALLFAFIGFYGAFSLSLVFTLMSAIAAKAHQNAAIMAILGFPLIIPQLLFLIRISRAAFGEVFQEGALTQMTLLLTGLNTLVIILSVVLFPFLWRE